MASALDLHKKMIGGCPRLSVNQKERKLDFNGTMDSMAHHFDKRLRTLDPVNARYYNKIHMVDQRNLANDEFGANTRIYQEYSENEHIMRNFPLLCKSLHFI